MRTENFIRAQPTTCGSAKAWSMVLIGPQGTAMSSSSLIHCAVTRPERSAKNLKDFVAWAKAQPDIKAKFATAGAEVHPLGPAEFAAFVKKDNEKWAKLIKERKLQLD